MQPHFIQVSVWFFFHSQQEFFISTGCMNVVLQLVRHQFGLNKLVELKETDQVEHRKPIK